MFIYKNNALNLILITYPLLLSDIHINTSLVYDDSSQL